jgi:lipid-binding SYLF domain-containing protein
MDKIMRAAMVVAVAAAVLAGCSNSPEPKSDAAKHTMTREVDASLTRLMEADPGLKDFIDRAHGYAIFPSIGKGGVVVGGAYGRGEVYEQDRQIGYADVTQATIGAQLGGQTFSELIVFENAAALDRFRREKYELAANVSAVALKAGAAASARYTNGVAVFVKPEGGAMFEASIGGQKFTFQPLDATGGTTTRPSR